MKKQRQAAVQNSNRWSKSRRQGNSFAAATYQLCHQYQHDRRTEHDAYENSSWVKVVLGGERAPVGRQKRVQVLGSAHDATHGQQ